MIDRPCNDPVTACVRRNTEIPRARCPPQLCRETSLKKRLMFTQGFVLWGFHAKDTQNETIIFSLAKTWMRRLILLS